MNQNIESNYINYNVGTEIKNININAENKNNNINETKNLFENKETTTQEKSNKVININRNIDFLKDDNSINFTLIEHNKSNEYDDKNQTLDLNIFKESDKLTISYYISKNEIMIDIFEEEISQIIEDNKNIQNLDVNNIKIKEFEFNSNSQTAIPFLNSISINNFEKIKDLYLTNKEINIIFDIYFISEGKQDMIKNIENRENKWEGILNISKSI